MTEPGELKRLLDIYKRVKAEHEVTIALMGLYTPPHIRIGYEDSCKQILELEKLIQDQESSPKMPLDQEIIGSFQSNAYEQRSKVEKFIQETKQIRFVNRLQDLTELRAFTVGERPVIFLDAPAYFGKTALFDQIRRVEKDNPTTQRWTCVSLDLAQTDLPIDSEGTFLNEIARQLSRNLELPIGSIMPGRSAGERVEGLASTLLATRKNTLIWLDNLHALPSDLIAWLLRDFVCPVVTGFYLPILSDGPHLRVLISGRYLAQNYDKEIDLIPERLRRRRTLTPFDRKAILQLISEITRELKLVLPPDFVERIVDDIFQLSGGHPQAIAAIVEHELARRGFALSGRWTPEAKRRIFRTYVQPVVDQVIVDLPANLRQVLEVLSVFRRFLEDTLRYLIDDNYLASSNPRELMDELVKSGLVRKPGIQADQARVSMYEDQVIRRLLAARLKYNPPPGLDWSMLQQRAEHLYNSWIDGKAPTPRSRQPAGRPTRFLVRFTQESLYHYLEHVPTGNPTEVSATLRAKVGAGLESLSDDFWPPAQELHESIEHDPDLPFLIQSHVGPPGYQEFMSWILNTSFN